MTLFSSVYRLQLCASFPLKKATKCLPYLKELGIEAVYCSPFYDACSAHGYDVTNPNQLNPMLGTAEDFDAFCQTLKALELGHVIDVIPNHMGFKKGKNAWWQDVLKKGKSSQFAPFFDINFNPDKRELKGKVLLPILGVSYGEALEKQQIKLEYDEKTFFISYGDFILPLNPKSLSLIEKHLPRSRRTPASYQKVLALFNGNKRQQKSFDLLDELLEAQVYRLAYWKVASHEINYRRFFNIHELVAIRIEEEKVFKTHHKWIFQLIKEGKVQGLRIDHPDGLYDPVTYFKKLKTYFPGVTVVEKILDRKEALPSSWAVSGTVGYEFLNILNGVFIKQESEKEFTSFYEQFIGEKIDFDALLYQKKKLFAKVEMVSEIEALGLMLDRLSETSRYYRDFTRHDLTRALQEVVACFPVYRSYIPSTGKESKIDAKRISVAIEKAKSQSSYLDPSIFAFLEKLLLLKLKGDAAELQGYRNFILRFQQLTAPIMAKGLEDTCFYIYNRFISVNEVGGDPPHFGHSTHDFHRFNQEKLTKWPLGFLPSSTHDTKRSEDVRMRLNVLSELVDSWKLNVKKWALINAKYKTESKGQLFPTANTEYLIYQTLIGAWPKEGELEGIKERFWEVILKSIREARVDTSWVEPNSDYEQATKHFLDSILESGKGNMFLKHFLPFQKQVDRLGGYNSLSMSALKLASPGIADVFQGNELFTYRLVDPDNRVDVDFAKQQQVLHSVKKIRSHPENIKKAFKAQDSGKIKALIHTLALNFRTQQKDLFCYGEYIPLRVRGQCKDHLIAFCRKNQNQTLLVLVGRFFASLKIASWELPLGHVAWGDTEVIAPKEVSQQQWTNLFTSERATLKKQKRHSIIKVADVFTTLPVAYLVSENDANRL